MWHSGPVFLWTVVDTTRVESCQLSETTQHFANTRGDEGRACLEPATVPNRPNRSDTTGRRENGLLIRRHRLFTGELIPGS